MGIEKILNDQVIMDKATKIISVSSEFDYKKSARNFGRELFHCMKQNKYRIAQYLADTDEIDTYESFLNRTVRTALTLQERQLDKNDVICLSSYNQLNNTVPFLASIFLGIKVASVDPSFTVPEVTHLIKLIKPKMFFIVPEIVDIITKSIELAQIDCEIIIYGDNVDTTKFTSFNSFLKERKNEQSFLPVEILDDSETGVIFFSSGTTGLPKGICGSYKALYGQCRLVEYLSFIDKDSKIMLFTTLYWITGVLFLLSSALTGAARVVYKKYDAKATWQILHKYKVTFGFVAPILATALMNAGHPKDIDTSNLLLLIVGGAKFSDESVNTLRNLLPETLVTQGFGMTEAVGFLTSFLPKVPKSRKLSDNKPSSVGMPLPGIQYRIVDPETEKVCNLNETGELRLKSPYLLNGYYNADASEAFDKDGWLKTGDLGHFDDDFCFYIDGRIKEMLKYKSWHVSPVTLELLLNTHPAIEESVVIGIPHDIDGDHPMALIVRNKNYEQQLTVNEIDEFISERVNDTHKLRGGIRFINTVPRTPTGKIKRKEIREIILKELNLING